MFCTSTVLIAPEWQAALRAHGLDCFERLWTLRGQAVKTADSSEVLCITLAGHCLFLKKYWVTSANQLLSAVTRGALLGRSKVRREFENMQRLRAWGLDAPTPVAYGEERRAGWLVRSFLISEAVPDPIPLDEFIVRSQARSEAECRCAPERHSASLRGSLQTQLITRLADYVRRLHEHRFQHHDLYWRNIILSGDSFDHFYLIDAHKGRCWRGQNDQRCRAHDLATLDAPAPAFFRRSERLRFFLRYRGHDRLSAEDKSLIRRALRLAEPMRERQLRRIRQARR